MFDEDVWICLCCGYPVIFRYAWHQPYHIPEGFTCWELNKAGECSFEPVNPLKTLTSDDRLEKEVMKAEKAYREYKRHGRQARMNDIVRRNLRAGRRDVLGAVMLMLHHEETVEARRLMRNLVGTRIWQDYIDLLKREQEA